MSSKQKKFAGKESFQRMNYLYQASTLLIETSRNTENKANKRCLEFISNYYSSLVVNIGKKTVLRMEPELKRSICKGCHKLLIPGQTARVRLRKKSSHHILWTCLQCKTSRRYIVKKDYQIWSEKPEALVE